MITQLFIIPGIHTNAEFYHSGSRPFWFVTVSFFIGFNPWSFLFVVFRFVAVSAVATVCGRYDLLPSNTYVSFNIWISLL